MLQNDRALAIAEILERASTVICSLRGQTLDVLEVARPPDAEYARHLAKVVSKLSPLIGNMIEFATVSELNKFDWGEFGGEWKRQDPGFPDNILDWDYPIKPGIEVKTWFPLATEITARFKDSIHHFDHNQTNVALIAWLPEYLIYGKPKVIDVWIDTGKSVALARDLHYHNPPDYLVFEPEDTTARTSNLQQTNTNGYKFQGTPAQFREAEAEVRGWGDSGRTYLASVEYQNRLKLLMGKYPYRLDTNFAKMDRIEHAGLEVFKTSVLSQRLFGRTILEWVRRGILEDGDLDAFLKQLNIE